MQARHELLGGKVQVYKRVNSPVWQCSASVGGRQYRATTKHEGLSQARDFAEDWFLTLKGKERVGGGLPKGKTFSKAAEKFLDEFEVITGGERSPKYIDSLRSKINCHLNPFFGQKAVTEISESLIQDYRVHRAKAVGKDGTPKPPARTTMHHEMITLGHVLKTAKRHDWLEHLPDLSAPYRASGKISHRAWFSLDEYRKLWKTTQARAKNPSNPKWKWQCEQLHDYVLFVANTGLLPDEAARLEFRDVVITFDDAPIELNDLEALNELNKRTQREAEQAAAEIAQLRGKLERISVEQGHEGTRIEDAQTGLARLASELAALEAKVAAAPVRLPEPILEIEVRGKRGVGFCKSMSGAVRPFLRLRNRLRAVPEDHSDFTRDRRQKLASRRPVVRSPSAGAAAEGASAQVQDRRWPSPARPTGFSPRHRPI